MGPRCSDMPIPGEPALPQNCCEPVLEGRGSPCPQFTRCVFEEEECIVTLGKQGAGAHKEICGPRESGTPDPYGLPRWPWW